MSATAQYAAQPKVNGCRISTANPSRTGTGAMGVVLTAGPGGALVNSLIFQAITDTLAGVLRMFVVKGRMGATINTMTFVDTLVTVTTQTPHGLTSGDLITVQRSLPDQYNVDNLPVTVLSTTTFTYVVPVAPTVTPSQNGVYSTTPAAPVAALAREILVPSVGGITPRTLSTMTAAAAVITATTTTAHGLQVGDVINVAGAVPAQYNGSWAVASVPSSTTFTFSVAVAPGTNATTVGAYSTIKQGFSSSFSVRTTGDTSFLPLVLPPGYSLRVSTNNADTFDVMASNAGDFA